MAVQNESPLDNGPFLSKRRTRNALVLALAVLVGLVLVCAAVIVPMAVTGSVFFSTAAEVAPTDSPTRSSPNESPSQMPSIAQSNSQTPAPTENPTAFPTTRIPTLFPTTQMPTSSPTQMPTLSPTTQMPTVPPTTQMPTSSPTQMPTLFVDPNPVPDNPPRGYFNYDINDNDYGPNAWDNVDTSESFLKEFDRNGFGAWKGHLAAKDPTKNRCSDDDRSPRNLSGALANEACQSGHEIRTKVCCTKVSVLSLCLSSA